MRAALLALVACGHAAPTNQNPTPNPAPPADARIVSQDEILAAIQKAMNELAPVANACWAKAATERFDIEGRLVVRVDIDKDVQVATVSDTTRSPPLQSCMQSALAVYRYAPPLRGQSFQLPFEFHAPGGQSVIDRRLVDAHAQGDLAVSVLLDDNNTGNAGVSVLELALKSGGTTGLRWADRAELWYFLGAAEVSSIAVAAGDMMYAPLGSAREVKAHGGDLHAVIVIVPGGREGAARAGALPNREVTAVLSLPMRPTILPASGAKTFGAATIFLDASIDHDTPLAASILQLPAGANVAAHVHAHETEMLYLLSGAGTMTIAGTDLPIVATSVVQIPPNTQHAFRATDPVRALQIYTPAGPEQRFKNPPKP